MVTVLLEEKREKVIKAFHDYTKYCPSTDEAVQLRAEKWLDEVLNFVESSHDIVTSDYQNVGKKIREFEKSCEDCRKGVVMKDDLFKHGDFYVKERMKVAAWVIGLVGVSMIGMLIFIFTQQFNALRTLTDLSLKMDKRIAIIEAHIGHSGEVK